MVEKLIISALSIMVGIIIARLVTYFEVHSLKEQLYAAQELNDKLIAENQKLRMHNSRLYDKLTDSDNSIPDFGKW